jgi:hypothetical protein
MMAEPFCNLTCPANSLADLLDGLNARIGASRLGSTTSFRPDPLGATFTVCWTAGDRGVSGLTALE